MSTDTDSDVTKSSGSEASDPSISVEISEILVAQDFTPFSRRAVESGILLAARFEARIHHVHVDESEEDEATVESLRMQMENEFDEALRSVGERTEEVSPVEEVDVVHDVLSGEGPTGAIVTYAYEHDVDLVVVGTHGRRGFRRLLLGSVAEGILHRAPCPVLAVRESPLSVRIERVLAPIDFSDHSIRALRYAREVAGRYEAEVDLLHVLRNLPTTPSMYPGSVESIYYDYDPEIEERAHERLSEIWTTVGGAEVGCTEYATLGSPPDVIVDYAEGQNDQLIVMGTRGQSKTERLLLGSVADRVVRSAGPPVLVVRSKETTPISRVHLREEILESDWYANQSEKDRELIRYFVGRSAEVLSHTSEEARLVLNMVASDNRYVHVPNEFIVEID